MNVPSTLATLESSYRYYSGYSRVLRSLLQVRYRSGTGRYSLWLGRCAERCDRSRIDWLEEEESSRVSRVSRRVRSTS